MNRQLPYLGGTNAGQGVHRNDMNHREYMHDLAARLRTARVACGDWQRVCTPSVTTRHGLTAILLDPPYGEGSQEYSVGGNADKSLAMDVWQWATENGNDPLLRIAVCGYEDGRVVPSDWSILRYTARKGYQQDTASAVNRFRECIWFSPSCLKPIRHEQHSLELTV